MTSGRLPQLLDAQPAEEEVLLSLPPYRRLRRGEHQCEGLTKGRERCRNATQTRSEGRWLCGYNHPFIIAAPPQALPELERAVANRDAASRDLTAAHALLDEVGVPRRLGNKPATVENRVRALLAAVVVGRAAREALAALGRDL